MRPRTEFSIPLVGIIAVLFLNRLPPKEIFNHNSPLLSNQGETLDFPWQKFIV